MKNQKNNFVYSLRITKEQRQLLKNNKTIKNDLNNYVRDYLNSFLGENKKS